MNEKNIGKCSMIGTSFEAKPEDIATRRNCAKRNPKTLRPEGIARSETRRNYVEPEGIATRRNCAERNPKELRETRRNRDPKELRGAKPEEIALSFQ